MKKHRNDVCRLAMLLAGGEHPAMSKGILADMQRFMEAYESDPVDPKALKIKGVGAQQVVEVTGTSTCSKAVPDCIPPVFSATLGCSGMHRFVCSKGRTRDELLSCWLAAISFYGGVPEEWVADNMSAIVTFGGRRRVKSDRVPRFAREAGFELCLCKLSYLSSGVWASRLLQLMPTFIGDEPAPKSCLQIG